VRGRLITLEGGEGAGKSTQAGLLANALVEQGVPVLRTREPGGAPGAEALRTLLLAGEVSFCPRAETLLYFGARAEHVARTIRPALEAGTWVVCDRFYDSTMAYQGYGLGVDRGMIATLIGMVEVHPDVTIVLDVSVQVAVERQVRRGMARDRYERLDVLFHQCVAAGFREIAKSAPKRCVIVNADADAQATHAAIMRVLGNRLGIGEGRGADTDTG
jgi:dTMP kinase